MDDYQPGTDCPLYVELGDTINLVNLSYDPDGDSFTSLWEITGPNGYFSTQTTHNATILGADTAYNWGDYQVRLTVTDIHNASESKESQLSRPK
ncbi:hypothetical protein ACVNS2_06500 [Paenibacillus caseinilyticus]|uniref:hypothetical protein n=1 Tax=Paenibacillus mucilaginosus TaxID=61624 RepID=UPI000FFE6F47|nr:hypothetical protein [Paenibacillus mucilaginosus]